MNDEQTLAAYSQFAHSYDASVVDFWAEFPRAFVQHFVQKLPGKRILNLGSGSGRDALLLRNAGLDVVCVDGACSMVAMTSGLGFESYLATFDQLPFCEDEFDGIWAHGSLLHIPKAEAPTTLTRLRALLRPKGLLAVGVIRGTGDALVAHPIMPDAQRYFQFYQSDELRQLIEPLGFDFLHQTDYELPYDTFLNHIYQTTK